MNAQQLLTIYPQATVSALPSTASNIVCIALSAGKYVCIDTTNLEQRELSLLEMLTQTKPSPTTNDQWSEFLSGSSPTVPHTTAKQFQLLQFRVRFTDQHTSHSQWLQALADLFDSVIHKSFVTGNTGYLLVAQSLSASQSDLKGLLSLLDNDFYTNTHLFIGSIHKDVQDLPHTYALEQQLFDQNQHDTIVPLSASLLPFLATQHHSELTALSTELFSDTDNQQLITALYHTQGNVRQAASNLFLHRNTLLYRIEKFERCSGLNLKDMDDLVYCYLLTLEKS